MADKMDSFVNKEDVLVSTIAQENSEAAVPDSNFKEGDDDSILNQVKNRLNEAYNYWNHQYEQTREDVRFTYGDQWPEEDIAQRNKDDRAVLVLNHLPNYVKKIIGIAQSNKFGIKVKKLYGLRKASPTKSGGSLDDVEILNGLIRSIEMESMADKSYTMALQDAIDGGFGWLYVKTERPYNNPFSVTLSIEHVKDRYSVIMDPYSVKVDYSDAKWCCMSSVISMSEFRARYPDQQYGGFSFPFNFDNGNESSGAASWWGGGTEGVRVLRYWRKVPTVKTAVKYSTPDGEKVIFYLEDIKKARLSDLINNYSLSEESRIKVETYSIKYMTCIYNKVLERDVDWPSQFLPLVPVTGMRVMIDGSQRFFGITHFAKDPQKMVNYWMVAGTEKVALSANNKAVVTTSQIAGHEDQWQDAHNSRNMFLLVNEPKNEFESDRIQNLNLSQSPSDEIQLLAMSKQLLSDTTGIQDASLGKKSNETSGRAIELRREASDASTNVYFDNLRVAINSIGNILADMIPNIMEEDEVRRIIKNDGTEDDVHFNLEMKDEQTKTSFRIADFMLAKYSVTVDSGPNAKTLNEEFVSQLLQIYQYDQAIVPMSRDLLIRSMDGPYSQELANRANAIKPPEFMTQQEIDNRPQPQPTPEQQIQTLELQTRQAEAEAKKIVAATQMEIAKIKEDIEETKLDQHEVSLDKEQVNLAKAVEDSSKPESDNKS